MLLSPSEDDDSNKSYEQGLNISIVYIATHSFNAHGSYAMGTMLS